MEWENAVQNILGVLKEIQKDNKEIKGDVKKIREDTIKNAEVIDTLYKKIEGLEIENKKLKEQLIHAEKKNKKNNIIIFGILENEDEKFFIINILKNKLEIELHETDINNLYRIGVKKDNKHRAVILELVRNTKKQEIFRNITKLKGTGISISNDLTEEERKQQKLLYTHYKLAKDKNYQAKIIKNKLIINGEVYTYDRLKIEEDENELKSICTIRENNSAPATPTQKYYKEIEKSDLEKKLQDKKLNQDKNKEEEKRTNAPSTPARSYDPKQKTGNKISKAPQGVLTRQQLQTQIIN